MKTHASSMKTYGRRTFMAFAVIAAGASVYAFVAEPERYAVLAALVPSATASDAAMCPPGACTIVVKTTGGGPPSDQIAVR